MWEVIRDLPPKGRYHWFDGDGMIHAVAFENGSATYRNRYVHTEHFEKESEAGESLWTGITERPDFTNPNGVWKDTANTDLVFHANRLLSMWWLCGRPHEIELPSLDTLGTVDFGDKRSERISAHPKVDPRTGELIVFAYSPVPPYLSYGVVSADGTLAHWTEVDLHAPRLQHDIAITERHTVLFDMSMQWDADLLARGQTKVRFYRDTPSRIGVIPRFGAGSDVRWFEVEPMFMYHTINAGRGRHPLAHRMPNRRPARERPNEPDGYADHSRDWIPSLGPSAASMGSEPRDRSGA